MQHLQRTFDDEPGRDSAIEAAKAEVLRAVAYALLRQVYGVTEQRTPDVQHSINFYDEVRRFEVNLIKQALLHTNGKKKKAARLLNLNPTTLHSKIKLYRIDLPVEMVVANRNVDIFANSERK